VAVFDGDGSLWRLTLARWPPDRLARHRALAANLVRAGWREDTASYVSFSRIRDEDFTDGSLPDRS